MNGWEFLLSHNPTLWDEIESAIAAVDSASCKTMISKDKQKDGRTLYAPKEINRQLEVGFGSFGWNPKRVDFWIPSDYRMTPKLASLGYPEQHALLDETGSDGYRSYNQIDFYKNRVSVEVQFGSKECVAYDLFVKHMSFFLHDRIDLGIEVLAMRSLTLQMPTGPGNFEGEVYNLLRQGRNIPPAPLIILGVDA